MNEDRGGKKRERSKKSRMETNVRSLEMQHPARWKQSSTRGSLRERLPRFPDRWLFGWLWWCESHLHQHCNHFIKKSIFSPSCSCSTFSGQTNTRQWQNPRLQREKEGRFQCVSFFSGISLHSTSLTSEQWIVLSQRSEAMLKIQNVTERWPGAYKYVAIAITYILKAKKFAEPPFQSKKNSGKSAGYFWAILGHFGSFLGHFGHFWAILGHICATLCHFGSFLGHFVAFLEKFAESSIFLRPRWGRGARF